MQKINSQDILASKWFLNSMTGFGQAHNACAGPDLTIALRAVNHKGLDIKLKAPVDIQPFEPKILSRVANKVKRGRIDVRVDFELLPNSQTTICFDHSKAQSLVDELLKFTLANKGVSANISAGQLLSCAELLSVNESKVNNRVLEDQLNDCLDAALYQLTLARKQEGQSLAQPLKEMLEKCLSIVLSIKGTVDSDAKMRFNSFKSRVDELFGKSDISSERIYQECALLAERSDFKEEIDRLLAHIAHFSLICTEKCAKGRKLDFMCQEMLRESNTLLSKAFDHSVMKKGIELKSEIERLREQVQNIE